MSTVVADKVLEKTPVYLVRGGTKLIVSFHNLTVGDFNFTNLGALQAQCPNTVESARILNSDSISIHTKGKLERDQLMCLGRAAVRIRGMECDEAEFLLLDGRNTKARELKALAGH